MPSARKSAPPKAQAKAKRTAVPHGPSEGKGKPAASTAPAKASSAPAKKRATRTTRGGAAASKARQAYEGGRAQLPAKVTGSKAGKTDDTGQHSEQRGSTPRPSTTTRPTAELTPLQERFVLEYLKDFNGTRAYRAASPGCTPETARNNAARLLANAGIAAIVAAQREQAAARMALTVDRVWQETARLAFLDPRALFDADGSPLPVTELDDHTAAAIAGLEVLEQHEGTGEDRKLVGHVKKYRFADKNAALERAAKLLGAFKEDNRQRTDPLLALLDGMRRSAVPVVATPPQDDDAAG